MKDMGIWTGRAIIPKEPIISEDGEVSFIAIGGKRHDVQHFFPLLAVSVPLAGIIAIGRAAQPGKHKLPQ